VERANATLSQVTAGVPVEDREKEAVDFSEQNRGLLAQVGVLGLAGLLNGDPTGVVERGVKRLFRHRSAERLYIETSGRTVGAIYARNGPLLAVDCSVCGAFRLVALRSRDPKKGLAEAVVVACRHLRKAHRLEVLEIDTSWLPPGTETVVAEAMGKAAAS